MDRDRSGGGPNFELPTPKPESLEGEEQRQEKGREAPAAPAETAGKQAPAPALPALPDDIPAADTPVIGTPADDTAVAPTAADTTHPADDSDRIEPVWVHKAKEVIAKTQNDPYEQKHQMSQVKADYIQKRFNKQIKTDEAKA